MARYGSGLTSRFLLLFNRTFAIILLGLAAPDIVFLTMVYNYILINFIGYAFVFNEIIALFQVRQFWQKFRELLKLSAYVHKVELYSKVILTYMIVVEFLFENTYFVYIWDGHIQHNVTKTNAMKLQLVKQPEVSRVLFENALSFHLSFYFIGLIVKVSLISTKA